MPDEVAVDSYVWVSLLGLVVVEVKSILPKFSLKTKNAALKVPEILLWWNNSIMVAFKRSFAGKQLQKQ